MWYRAALILYCFLAPLFTELPVVNSVIDSGLIDAQYTFANERTDALPVEYACTSSEEAICWLVCA